MGKKLKMYIFANIQEITQFAYKNDFSEKKQKIKTKKKFKKIKVYMAI